MFLCKLMVTLGLLVLSTAAFATDPSREVRLKFFHTQSVSHLYNPAFLNSSKPLELDVTKIFQEFSHASTTSEALRDSVLLYASVINTMVDALNAASPAVTSAGARTFEVIDAPAQELLQQLQSMVNHDNASSLAVGLNFTQVRVLKPGHIRVGSDLFLEALGISGLDCTNLELPMPSYHCIFYRI